MIIGSFLEFLGILEHFKKKYTPESLPYHLVAPSLTGYAFSSGPPLSKDWNVMDTTRIMHKAMMEIGFERGFVAQGGDIGSAVSQILARQYESCAAVHLNFAMVRGIDPPPVEELSAVELAGLERLQKWFLGGTAYAQEQGTRPATIGLALSASPIAMLAWIGEKYLEWSDEDPSVDTVLFHVSLYWLTDTYARSVYPYRGFFGNDGPPKLPPADSPIMYIQKPLGYSLFPKEIMATPVATVKKCGNLVWSRVHEHVSCCSELDFAAPSLTLTVAREGISQHWRSRLYSRRIWRSLSQRLSLNRQRFRDMRMLHL